MDLAPTLRRHPPAIKPSSTRSAATAARQHTAAAGNARRSTTCAPVVAVVICLLSASAKTDPGDPPVERPQRKSAPHSWSSDQSSSWNLTTAQSLKMAPRHPTVSPFSFKQMSPTFRKPAKPAAAWKCLPQSRVWPSLTQVPQ